MLKYGLSRLSSYQQSTVLHWALIVKWIRNKSRESWTFFLCECILRILEMNAKYPLSIWKIFLPMFQLSIFIRRICVNWVLFNTTRRCFTRAQPLLQTFVFFLQKKNISCLNYSMISQLFLSKDIRCIAFLVVYGHTVFTIFSSTKMRRFLSECITCGIWLNTWFDKLIDSLLLAGWTKYQCSETSSSPFPWNGSENVGKYAKVYI